MAHESFRELVHCNLSTCLTGHLVLHYAVLFFIIVIITTSSRSSSNKASKQLCALLLCIMHPFCHGVTMTVIGSRRPFIHLFLQEQIV